MSTLTKEIFQQVYNLISDPKKWCQKHGAVDNEGNAVSVWDSAAVAWCMDGACYSLGGGRYAELSIALTKTAYAHDYVWFSKYNDEHTHEEVMAFMKETGEREGWL